MDYGIHNTSSTNKEDSHCNHKPNSRLQQNHSHIFESGCYEHDDNKEYEVFHEDSAEREYQLNVGIQSFVEKVKDYLGFVHLIRPNQPLVFFLQELFIV